MTPDERAQLVEDIKRSDNLRRGIIERAELSKDFDLLAAWKKSTKSTNPSTSGLSQRGPNAESWLPHRRYGTRLFRSITWR